MISSSKLSNCSGAEAVDKRLYRLRRTCTSPQLALGLAQHRLADHAVACAAVNCLQDWKRATRRLLESGDSSVGDMLTHAFKAQLIRTVLELTRSRRIEAAHRLGIGRNTIMRKIQGLKWQYPGADIAGFAIPHQFDFALVFEQDKAVFVGQRLAGLDQRNQVTLFGIAQIDGAVMACHAHSTGRALAATAAISSRRAITSASIWSSGMASAKPW